MLTIYLPLNNHLNKFEIYCAILLFGFIINPFTGINAQFTYESTVKTEARFFTIDPFENILLSESGKIVKIEKKSGKKTFFSNPKYGFFDIIDSSDPLNILVFSKDLSIVTLLDKNLIEKESVSFYKEGSFEKPELACNSRHDGFWIYISDFWQFQRVDRRNQIISATPQMNILNFNFSTPCYMIEVDSRLYVSDKNNGIFVFDIFGSFLFKVPLKNICNFQVKGDNIIYFTDEHLHVYNFFLKNERLYLLPEKNIIMGYLKYPYVYILTQGNIKRYKTDINIFN